MLLLRQNARVCLFGLGRGGVKLGFLHVRVDPLIHFVSDIFEHFTLQMHQAGSGVIVDLGGSCSDPDELLSSHLEL